jgi:hypothetical protein
LVVQLEAVIQGMRVEVPHRDSQVCIWVETDRGNPDIRKLETWVCQEAADREVLQEE